MEKPVRSTRDVIIRTENWHEAEGFYAEFFGIAATHYSETLIGFDTGEFRLFIEKGQHSGPVFEFLVPDVRAMKHKLVAAGCKVLEEDPSVPRCYVQDAYGLVFNIGPA